MSQANRVIQSILAFGIFLPALSIHAAGVPSEYDHMLSIAEKKVQRERARAGAGALSVSPQSRLLPRPYAVGDQWDVIAIQTPPQGMRMVSPPEGSSFGPTLQNPSSRVGIFHYEVREATRAPEQITVEITQKEALGLKKVDPHVVKIILSGSAASGQTVKKYVFTDHPQPVAVSPEGVHSAISVLELFPLDYPDILTAERKMEPSLPPIPDMIRTQAGSQISIPDLSQSEWFEQDDFFGRPIQILWERGKLWPSYLRMAGGAAYLLEKSL